MINQFSFQDVNYLLYSIVLECSFILLLNKLHFLKIRNLGNSELRVILIKTLSSIVTSPTVAITIIKTSTNNCIRGCYAFKTHINKNFTHWCQVINFTFFNNTRRKWDYSITNMISSSIMIYCKSLI